MIYLNALDVPIAPDPRPRALSGPIIPWYSSKDEDSQ
jgi:hypothetical protein